MDAVVKPIRAPSIKRGEKIIIDANAGSGKTTALIGVMAVAIRQSRQALFQSSLASRAHLL